MDVRRFRVFAAVVSLLVWLGATASAWAHPPMPTYANVDAANDGRVTVTVTHDALAFALDDTSARVGDPAMYDLLYGPRDKLAKAFDDGRQRFVSMFKVKADGKELPFKLEHSPDLAAADQWKIDNPDRATFSCKMDFVASFTLPPGTKAITLKFPNVMGEVIVFVNRPGVDLETFPIGPGDESGPIDMRSVGPAPQVQPEEVQHASTTLGIFWEYIRYGFGHIIPEGVDHAFFVLGLFLLSPRIKPVLWQISAFTVAHTITLSLATIKVNGHIIVNVPSNIVEPTIAASIAFIGVENLLTTRVHAWRPVVAFIFGLVHGLGVATAFREVGFPPDRLVTSLAAFTVGVEAGHLAVLLAAFLILGWFRNKPWYRQRIAIPLSLMISVVALYWVQDRLFDVGGLLGPKEPGVQEVSHERVGPEKPSSDAHPPAQLSGAAPSGGDAKP